MKSVLLVGGFGGLGYHVAKKFVEEGWEVRVAERKGVSGWHTSIEEVLPTDIPVTVVDIDSYSSDVTILLAESNDPSNIDNFSALETNILLSNYLGSRITYSSNARLVVVGWSEKFSNKTVFGKSLNDRMAYPAFYNIGNNVISFIRLPRLISPYHYSLTFGNIVKRVYKAIQAGIHPIGIDREISRHHVEWIKSNHAADVIYSQSIKRTRETHILYGMHILPIDIARVVANMMNAPNGLEFRTRHKTYNLNDGKYKIPNIGSDSCLKAIEECIDVWNRQPQQP